MSKDTFYITTPIYYPNAEPHLGHAYTTVIADATARYYRMTGKEVYFLTGTDENTQKVIQAAQQAGEEPRTYLEKIVKRFKELYGLLNISYSQFIRTSDEKVHWPGVMEMWKRIEANGDLYKGEYKGFYCIGCETFLTEKDLIDGKCPDHGTKPQVLSEENYFFKLSSYADRLKELIENDVINITPAFRKTEVLTFLNAGLRDVSFSRPAKAIEWGVPVPGDESQKMYVWMDALTNYITALGFGREEENMHFWPGTHIVGKDILRFHAVIWPAMLLSAKLPLPKTIVVHGMIISGGRKMSKSIGNVINPKELVERYGTDATRYLLLRHVHPVEDTDITGERLDEWYTAGLVNGLGNLVARVMKLSETHLETGVRSDSLLPPSEYTSAFESFDLQAAADYVWSRIQALDKTITDTRPFSVVKEHPEEGKRLISEAVTELYAIARLLRPIMPETSKKIQTAVVENKMPPALFPRKE